MDVRIEPSWAAHIGEEFDKPYFASLVDFVRREYAGTACYPPGREIFNAFNLCPFDKVKVVIIGQDPYHEPGQAEGLCFSVKEGVVPPPSLVNIFREIASDLGSPMPANGSLRRWACQGVLLLNATLTVRAQRQARQSSLKAYRTEVLLETLRRSVQTVADGSATVISRAATSTCAKMDTVK